MLGDKDDVSAYMPWWLGDYRRDTADLSCLEHGAYLQLLAELWLARGYLSYDPERLARRIHLDPTLWAPVWKAIERFFDVFEGRISQKRLLRELEKARQMRGVLSRAGKRGAAAKWGHAATKDGQAIARPMAEGWQSSPSPDPDQTGRGEDSSSSPAPAPRATGAADEAEALLLFPVVRGRRSNAQEWRFTEAEATVLREGFPHLDVISEARKAWAWIVAKPERRKTAKGMLPFLVGWLGRAQNRGGARTGPPAAPQCAFHREVPDKPATEVDRNCPTCKALGTRRREKKAAGAEPEDIAAIMATTMATWPQREAGEKAHR